MTLKTLFVFGTRPEAIKMAPVIKAFAVAPDMDAVFCVTAQHRQMLDQVMELFSITPDFDLTLMKPGQDLYDITSKALVGLRDVLKDVRPDIVLVHGDTTTTLAATLAAFYAQIPVAHVEAGLRTGDLSSPGPKKPIARSPACLRNFTSRRHRVRRPIFWQKAFPKALFL